MRSVLIWLMVLAMPVQGMAASTMVFCGPLHERMMLPPAAADHDESAVPEHEHLWLWSNVDAYPTCCKPEVPNAMELLEPEGFRLTYDPALPAHKQAMVEPTVLLMM